MDHFQTSKVLIVDDEPHIAQAIDYLLTKAGFITRLATNGKEALQIAEVFQPEIVILDVMMPEMNGYDVAKELYRRDLSVHSSIIFLTARGAEADRAAGYASGGEYYITKPFDNEALVRVVQEVLEFG
jgi:DNA-binding response OmpR family regulator